MKTAAILLAVAVSGSEAPEQTFTRDEMQRTIVMAVQHGRALGIAEASAALEEAQRTLERCAISRPI